MTYRPPRRASAPLLALLVVAALPLTADDGHDHTQADFSHPITTSSPDAQGLFDQGLQVAWGFNHKEAARLFDRAIEADPECAMCWWGRALVLGPNINAPLNPADHPAIVEAMSKARELAARVTEREQAYIRALENRYGPEPVEDRSRLDKAYADAMRRVAYSDPDDLTAATLFAEALMDTTPWDYWLPDGEPKEVTSEFIQVLETVLRRDATHPGAAHLLIHAVEKARPELGVPAAEMLDRSEQATGHLVHMASHIYLRVGRWDDAARVNQRAIEEDDAYAAENEVPFDYIPYMLHNHHMRWAALAFDGRREEAWKEAEYLQSNLPPTEVLADLATAGLQHFWAVPLWDAVWFEDWERVLAAPEPPESLVYARGVWHWARGTAQAHKGDAEGAAAELEVLRSLLADSRFDGLMWNFNSARSILEIGREALAGEVAAARGDLPSAVRRLADAARREDALLYMEPPDWLGPTRERLAEVQLAAGDAKAAEETLRTHLGIYPHSGRALHALVESLEMQGRSSEADEVRFQLAAAWARAEIDLE